MARVGIDVAVVSWWGQESNKASTDTQGVSTDAIFSNLLDILDNDQSSVKIALHLEPYPSRNVQSIRGDVEYIYKKYGHHKSLFRSNGKLLFYVYDSYHIRAHEWSSILQPGGVNSLRGTEFDGIFIGLWLHHHDGRDLLAGGFDGVYSYFASAGFLVTCIL
jgi:glycoprotein endo-alpha-1,2-mannosidase